MYRFPYVELPLHPWNEANLVMVNDLSDMLLDLVCHKECSLEEKFKLIGLANMSKQIIFALGRGHFKVNMLFGIGRIDYP
jgi:hypothetical protein